MASTSNPPNASATIQDLQYLYASNTNVSNFVSVKLSSYDNYHLWKSQMLCLMEAHDMRDLVDNWSLFIEKHDDLLVRKYNSLLKGWIFGSVSENVLRIVVDPKYLAKDVWIKLKLYFDSTRNSDQQDTETIDKVELRKQKTEVNLTGNEIKNKDMDSAICEDSIQTGTKDSAPTKVDNKVQAIFENLLGRARKHEMKFLQKLTMAGDWEELLFLVVNASKVTEKIYSDGNTVLHVAVGMGRNDFIRSLIRDEDMTDTDLTEVKNLDGSTVLHIAVIVGNKIAAELLVQIDERLLHIPNNKGQTPLHKACENMHLDTIAYLLEATENRKKGADVDGSCLTKSSILPNVEIGIDLLVTAISTKQYDFASMLMKKNPEYVVYNDNVLMAMARTFPSGLDYGETLICPSFKNIPEMIVERTKRLFHMPTLANVKQQMLRPRHNSRLPCLGAMLIFRVPLMMVYYICVVIHFLLLMVYFTFFVVYFLLWKFAATIVPAIKTIEQKKKHYEEAKVVLELICKKVPVSSHDLYTRPILEAARQDAYEVVVEILQRWPVAIRCEDKNGYDIIMLAIIYRSEKIYNLIYMFGERKSIYGTIEDSSKNNLLHLVGRLAPSNKLKLRTGTALQLQRELQWREEVQKLVFPTYITKENIFMETPDKHFTKEHENLVKEGEQWMKTVAESSSITAALITTIVFAAAITIPGGNNQETGAPLFLKQTAFTIFAISDAISLFFSATALLVFLSILTARFAEQDFLVSLPRRLIIGLCTLLISTTAMMVAFSATLFLVFSRHKLWMLAPICGLAFIPIAIFFILQAPLIVDLFRSTYISRFGKSNHNSSKFDPNEIRFFFGK